MIGHGYVFKPDLDALMHRRARRLALYRAAWWCALFVASGVIWAVVFWLVGMVVR